MWCHRIEESEMIRNMGSTDRLLRAVLVAPALVIVALLVGATTPIGIVALAVAGVMLATAAVGSCPLYRLVGVDTCKTASR
jgi:hypothetical protein